MPMDRKWIINKDAQVAKLCIGININQYEFEKIRKYLDRTINYVPVYYCIYFVNNFIS